MTVLLVVPSVSLALEDPLDQSSLGLPQDVEVLRTLGQEAFRNGDYEQMSNIYRRLAQADEKSIDDARWLGHAGQLGSQWKEAAEAYTAAIDRMGQLLDQPPAEDQPGLAKQQEAREKALQQRAAAILLTARIQQFYLKDPIAAETTLRRVYDFNDVFAKPVDVIAKMWEQQLAEVIEWKPTNGPDWPRIRQGLALRFPMMALRELAAMQQLNGNNSAALETWRRVHVTTQQYIGSTESIDAKALDRLIRQLPDTPDLSIPGVTLLDPSHPTAKFELGDAASLAKAYTSQQNYWSFALAARKGQEFESVEFTCDIEQQELRYGGQLDCWCLAGERGSRKGIGGIHWPAEKPIGRDRIARKFAIEPGTGIIQFRTGSWKDKFKVHSVTVNATFRPRADDGAAPTGPIPGFGIQTEFLPKESSITLNGKPFGNETASHNMIPGRYDVEYVHPKLNEPRRMTLDLKSGVWYGLFLNLDSPFTSEMTNLRVPGSLYGPNTSVVKLRNGRHLIVWCQGGLQFSGSDDLVTWSDPATTDDAALFNENYNCISPSLYVDGTGVIWVAYFSNQLDIDQLSTGGYRLFLRSSKDGQRWSAPRPINNSLGGWPPSKVQIVDGPQNQAWLLAGMQYAVAETPADFGTLTNLEIPATNVQRSHARNPHATVDSAGRIHLVWDHFGQKLYYARRDVAGDWTEPVEIPVTTPNQVLYYPQLIVRNENLALIYTAGQAGYLRRGSFQEGMPRFGDLIKIASHIAPLSTAEPLVTSDDSVVLLSGKDSVWKLTTTMTKLLGDDKD